VKEDYKPLVALNMFGHGSSLGDRIERLLRPGREFAQASFGRIAVTAAVLLLLAGIGLQGPLWVAFAQQESLPSFEVATIKPAPPFSLEKMQSGQLHVVSIKGPQADFQFVSLSDLLVYAYRVKPYQIFGPSWIRDGRWDIVAKLPEGASQDRVPEMLRSLLVERFKLAAHHESREMPAYQLVVDKGGTKFQAAPPEEDSAPNKDAPATSSPTLPLGGFPGGGNMRFGNDGRGVITGGPNGTTRVSQAPSGGMRFEMSRMTMPALAEMLTPFLGRPVADGTGLKGVYQITLDLPFDAMLRVIQDLGGGANLPGGFAGFPAGGFGGGFGGFPGGVGGAPGAGNPGAASDPAASSVFQSVQQLGLNLQSGKVPVDTIVIDHLEKTPTEN